MDSNRELRALLGMRAIERRQHVDAGDAGDAGDDDIARDTRYFNAVRQVSREGLVPVLVRPCGWARDVYFAAFLIDSTPLGGWRLLCCDGMEWRVSRVKRRAEVLKLPEALWERHRKLLGMQSLIKELIHDVRSIHRKSDARKIRPAQRVRGRCHKTGKSGSCEVSDTARR